MVFCLVFDELLILSCLLCMMSPSQSDLSKLDEEVGESFNSRRDLYDENLRVLESRLGMLVLMVWV